MRLSGSKVLIAKIWSAKTTSISDDEKAEVLQYPIRYADRLSRSHFQKHPFHPGPRSANPELLGLSCLLTSLRKSHSQQAMHFCSSLPCGLLPRRDSVKNQQALPAFFPPFMPSSNVCVATGHIPRSLACVPSGLLPHFLKSQQFSVISPLRIYICRFQFLRSFSIFSQDTSWHPPYYFSEQRHKPASRVGASKYFQTISWPHDLCLLPLHFPA